MTMDISVVIPTRNRMENLNRLLACLSLQVHPLGEVIVVDSSDQQIDMGSLAKFNLPLKVIPSQPSVCAQRNLGIKQSRFDWILLCDDDIEMPADYVTKLAVFAEANDSANVISGLFLELDGNNHWTAEHPPSFRSLLWSFIFQSPVWADLNHLRYGGILNVFLKPIRQFYLWRQNTFTLAGWPLLVDFRPPFFRTSIYSLGASLIRKECLLRAPFDERLDPNGIGDNYGVAIHIGQERPIHVLTDAFVRHCKSPTNRLEYPAVYARRVLALHYFMKRSTMFTSMNIFFLLWSLIGNSLRQLIHGKVELATMSSRIFWTIITGNNPYLKASQPKQ